MNIVDKLHTDLESASNSLSGLSAFSSKDKALIGLLILLPIALNNLLWWFLQDVLLTQLIVVIVGYFVGPFILNKIIKKDIYVLLEVREHMPVHRSSIGWLWVGLAFGLPIIFLILGVWFNVLGASSINILAPYFNRAWANYAYLIFASILFCFVHPYAEGRFYYGVIDSILPNNIISRLILALLLSINYIGFSLALVGVRTLAFVTLLVIFGTYLTFSMISEKKGVKVAIFLFVGVSLVIWVLFLLFVVLKQNGNYQGGVILNLLNSRNVLN